MFYKKQLVLASFQLRQGISCQVAVSLLNRLHQSVHLYGPQPLIHFPRQNLGTDFPQLTTWFYHVQLKTGSWKSSTKHPKPISHKNYLFTHKTKKKKAIFCFHLSHRKFQYLPFLHSHQKSLEIFFLHKGDSAIQSVNCKPVSQQSINMTLPTKMLGQKLKTSLRFYIENWHLRWSMLTQVF